MQMPTKTQIDIVTNVGADEVRLCFIKIESKTIVIGSNMSVHYSYHPSGHFHEKANGKCGNTQNTCRYLWTGQPIADLKTPEYLLSAAINVKSLKPNTSKPKPSSSLFKITIPFVDIIMDFASFIIWLVPPNQATLDQLTKELNAPYSHLYTCKTSTPWILVATLKMA